MVVGACKHPTGHKLTQAMPCTVDPACSALFGMKQQHTSVRNCRPASYGIYAQTAQSAACHPLLTRKHTRSAAGQTSLAAEKHMASHAFTEQLQHL